MSDFISVYDNLLDQAFCQHLIDKFEASPHREPGVSGGGVNTKIKNSIDVTISSHAEWESEIGTVMNATLGGMVRYIREYVFFLTATGGYSFQHQKTGEQVKLGPDTIDMVTDQELATLVMKRFRFGHVNIQKYKVQEGGYFSWHSEVGVRQDDTECDLLHRTLFFIYYLNDVNVGGETELFYQKQTVEPKTGRLILSPAGFTHTHRGNMPVSNDKYILTSWIMLQPAKNLSSQR